MTRRVQVTREIRQSRKGGAVGLKACQLGAYMQAQSPHIDMGMALVGVK
jgi:hypothetical protein